MKRIKQGIVVATAVLLAWLAGWWISRLVQLCSSPESCRHADPAQPSTAPRAQTPVARRRTPHPTGVTTRNHSTSPAPDAPLWEERAARTVPGERLVAIRDGANVERLARSVGAEVIDGIDALRMIRLRFASEATARAADARLAGLHDVAFVGPNHFFDRPDYPVWPADHSGVAHPRIPPAPGPGDLLIIGLLDAGLPAVNGDAAGLFLAPPGDASALFPHGPGVGAPSHADAVAASILDGLVAALGDAAGTRVRILPVDVFGEAETTTSFHVAQGMVEAIEAGARIINLSLGGEESAAMLETLIRNAHARGVVFVGAAGNERTGRPVYPAAYPEVLAVTALDDDGMPMPEANEGPFVDVAAPGVVSFLHGPAWYIAIGTSISSGYVSGAIAGLADRLDQSAPDAEAAVRMLFADEAETP